MGYTNANFPDRVWDALSPNPFRTAQSDTINPNAQDWDQVVAEMQAVQEYVLAAGTPDDDANVWRVTTSVNVTAGDVVFVQLNGTLAIADATTQSDVNGFVLETKSIGEIVPVRTGGKYINNAWSLTPGRIYYLSVNGTIDSSPPSTGWVVQLGRAITSTGLNIEIAQPVRL